jgi:hypothetical protein
VSLSGGLISQNLTITGWGFSIDALAQNISISATVTHHGSTNFRDATVFIQKDTSNILSATPSPTSWSSSQSTSYPLSSLCKRKPD